MELGTYNQLGHRQPFISERSFQHTLFIGKPRTGKTTALVRLALDDIKHGHPVVFIGTDTVLSHIPEERQADVIYFNPADRDFPFAFNILSNVEKDRRALFATTVLDTVKGIWGYDQSPTPNIDQYIRAGLGALLEVPGTTLLSLKFLITDPTYRAEVLRKITDLTIKDFWNDFERLSPKEQRQDTASTLNKIRAFMMEPLVRNCIAQLRNCITFKDKIVVVSLPEAILGRENAALLGALILSQLYIDAQEGVRTHVYVDDAQRYGTSVLMSLLSACPSISAQLSLQYLDQLPARLQSALIGSVGTVVAFRTSVKDAEFLEPEFNLTNDHKHLYELHPFTAYVSMDGRTTELSMPVHSYPLTQSVREKIIKRCRSQYTTPREHVEKRLGRQFE